MARRKKQYISDDDLDSSDASASELDGEQGDDIRPDWDEDPDERAERLRFSDPYGRSKGNKRKRGIGKDNDKEEALYGVWAEKEEEQEDREQRGNGRSSKTLRRAQAFVPSSISTSNASNAQVVKDNLDHDKPMDLNDAVPLPDVAQATNENGLASSAEEDGVSESDEDSGSDSNEEDKKFKVRVPRNRDEEIDVEDEHILSAAMSNDGQHGAQRGGIGARSRGGIGSMARAAAATLVPEVVNNESTIATTSKSHQVAEPPQSFAETPDTSASKSTFGVAARERRSFLGSAVSQSSRDGTPTGGMASRKLAPISKTEQQHFSKIASQGGFGYKLLAKMGWSAGVGLGAQGEGIVTPIESKLRPKAMGLAYEGFKERTKQSKEEERRRKGSDNEDGSEAEKEAGPARRRKAKDKGEGTSKGILAPPSWKQSKASKTKVQHMTYEEIVGSTSDTGGATSVQAGVGIIYDLTGRELPAAALSGAAHLHDVPSSDSARLPELRHNCAIIVDTTKSDLDNLAREAKNVTERRKWLLNEEERNRIALQRAEAKIARLRMISAATASIQKMSASLTYDPRPASQQLELLTDTFDTLLNTATQEEYEIYRLDEVIVGAIAPIMKRAWQDWDPIASPTAYLENLKNWRKAFRLQKRDIESNEYDQQQVDVFGSSSRDRNNRLNKSVDLSMSAFESLLWTMWLPRLRSAINNEWDPAHPGPIITLFSTWKSSGLLPRFISDNILDQLVLPKLSKAINDWSPPRKSKASMGNGASLHHIVFPWLEHAGERMEEVLNEAKRTVRGWLKSWRPKDGLPDGLDAWRDIIPKTEWQNLILQHVVPQLSAHLREKFVINPRNQDLAPLSLVLSWRPLLRSRILSQILEAEIFPKYLDTLYTWLVSDSVNYEQVAEWYTWWKKDVFGNHLDLHGVERGFAKALDVMNQAMALGEDAKYRLSTPDIRGPTSSFPSTQNHVSINAKSDTVKVRQREQPSDITFRSVVEDVASENNLVFMSTGRSHEVSGMPLFRISSGIDGKSGINVYLRGDVVFAQEQAQGPWKPISVLEMVTRAKKGS